MNETLLAGLNRQHTPARKPYRLETVSLGGVMKGFDLNKALQTADALEDDELARRRHRTGEKIEFKYQNRFTRRRGDAEKSLRVLRVSA